MKQEILSFFFLIFYLGHIACLPPSTGRLIPVENEASSEAKNAIALATSSASPGRPSACVCLLFSKNWKLTIFSISNVSNRNLKWEKKHYLKEGLCTKYAFFWKTRGKSLLELWPTSFLPDWQPPLIFVWFTSKSHEH